MESRDSTEMWLITFNPESFHNHNAQGTCHDMFITTPPSELGRCIRMARTDIHQALLLQATANLALVLLSRHSNKTRNDIYRAEYGQ